MHSVCYIENRKKLKTKNPFSRLPQVFGGVRESFAGVIWVTTAKQSLMGALYSTDLIAHSRMDLEPESSSSQWGSVIPLVHYQASSGGALMRQSVR